MATRSIVIVGGGPAGLLAARLLARAGFKVSVFERLHPGATYGFGVALAGRAIDLLREHDGEAASRISEICHPLQRWTMRRDDDSASIEDRGSFGVERAGLLTTLQSLAVEAGAQIAEGVEYSFAQASAGSLPVIFAEGVGSQGRQALADTFGARVESVPLPYIWCGADLNLDAMTLDLRRTPDGIFCGHVMPYGNGNATFQIDTLPQTLASAGLPAGGEIAGPLDASDEQSLSTLSHIFAPLLDGKELLGNRSRWSTFRLVRSERWSTGKFVLVGDAAHTAHYTVGSGTRMAMEDAIVLAEALSGEGSLTSAFNSYEAARRPAVEHLQWRASRSQTWWATLPARYDLPLPVLLFSYFTRTGSVGLEGMAKSNPAIATAALRANDAGLAEFGAVTSSSIDHLEVPSNGIVAEALRHRFARKQDLCDEFVEVPCDGLQPWSHGLAEPAGAYGGPPKILLTGGDERRLVLERFDIAEELRRAGATVAVVVPQSAVSEGATAVVAGRADLVALGTAAP